jgi:omega-amidase
MHISILQYDITWEDKDASQSTMNAMLEASPPAEGGLLLLPELGDVGFSFRVDRISDERSLEWARSTAIQYRCWVQHGYAEQDDDGRGLNTASLVAPDGTLVGSYRKIHLFPDGESSHYAAGDRLVLRHVDGACLCPFICYDLRFPELWRLARRAGAEVFTIGASWPAERNAHWRAMLIARAIENQAFVVACNRTGSDPHLSYVGNSMVISPRGEIIAEADDSSTLLHADINLDEVHSWRETMRFQDDAEDRFLGSIEIDRVPTDGRG